MELVNIGLYLSIRKKAGRNEKKTLDWSNADKKKLLEEYYEFCRDEGFLDKFLQSKR